jgi:hypothetical protein
VILAAKSTAVNHEKMTDFVVIIQKLDLIHGILSILPREIVPIVGSAKSGAGRDSKPGRYLPHVALCDGR